MTPSLRLMMEENRDALMTIQHNAYAERFYEEWSVFLDKLRLYPAGCWVCVVDDVIAGYLFSHPSTFSNPPALNKELGGLPDSPDCYYIHDLAIHTSYQGKRIGQMLSGKAIELSCAGGFTQMALIAVQKSQPFWSKYGFKPVILSPDFSDKLATYSEDATYMRRGSDA